MQEGPDHDHPPGENPDDRLMPPGQTGRTDRPVRHYGPVPKVRDRDSWMLSFGGATKSDESFVVSLGELEKLPRSELTADMHCAGKFTTLDNIWEGIRARDVVEAYPPLPGITNVIVYGQYGYSANVRLDDLLADNAMLATHQDGELLTPEHGFPVRLVIPHLYSWKGPKWFRGWEYLLEPRRGFWEERGYHLRGQVWAEERWSYQETHPGRLPSQSADRGENPGNGFDGPSGQEYAG
ncbi:molybdopterin-dependent oxidoreductase [Kineosporia babensis]|uniref:Molybdopterin-dependent oxidoreductase n=1 Tax=Kineosporia babensis TaxID=499548 RepID=A0A9X1NAC0_9ACTN|nr:molybdopterin-dependent oxidoreductase [Kineosporia babensis]MCD5310084.1 molybdopterin-dependent oxidoreductase [Kineosporia babensis]